MKIYNLSSIIICIIILVITFFTFNDVEPSIGKATLFGVFMYSIFAICGIMFIVTLIIAIIKKKLLDIYTLLNLVVISVTSTSPFWIV